MFRHLDPFVRGLYHFEKVASSPVEEDPIAPAIPGRLHGYCIRLARGAMGRSKGDGFILFLDDKHILGV